MAKRTGNQGTGDRGELSLRAMFADCGYATSEIKPDFGEDFFVFCQDGEYIEPFRIFVQSKASEQLDTTASDWTEYCDPMTVRNWVLNNELTVVVRQNLASGERRYCIPEEDIDYWSIDPTHDVPVRLTQAFDQQTVKHLVWRARLRHYDHVVRLVRPNDFESEVGDDVPAYRKFVVELLLRLGLLDTRGGLSNDTLTRYNAQYMTLAFGNDMVPAADMSLHEVLRYSACLQLTLGAVHDAAGTENGLSPLLLDDCACVLALHVLAEESMGTVLKKRPDSTLLALRSTILMGVSQYPNGEPVLTGWIDGGLQPIRPGVYQRDDGELGFSYWSGMRWQGWAPRFDTATDGSLESSSAVRQELPWRGVAEPTPELQLWLVNFLAVTAQGDDGTRAIEP
jgi:hypothetical protein